jgi:chromatin segregation and condensation protein Rec8/ScpA/Scc1 (kleisin family)
MMMLSTATRAVIHHRRHQYHNPPRTIRKTIRCDDAEKYKRELSDTHDKARKLLARGGRLMDRLKSLEIGAKLAMKRNDETQLRQIARDRVVVKEGLKELVMKIEAQRAFAEALEKALDSKSSSSSSSSYLPYETEEEIEEKFRKLERQQERLKVDWLDNL